LTWELHPTAALEVEEERRKLLGWDGDENMHNNNNNNNNNHSSSFRYRRQWLATEQNAVYATIPDVEDPKHTHNRALHEFHKHRHLSRFEKQYRERHNLDLLLDWNGEYDDDFHVLMEMEESTFRNSKKKCQNNNSTTTSTKNVRRLYQNQYYFQSPRTRTNTSYVVPAAASSTTSTYSNNPEDGNTSNRAVIGGQWNNYQEVPLSQGYGTHFANVWVGSPMPQRKTVIVDTGSHYTAFPCSPCRNCGAHHHTDPYFRPDKSDTFHYLQCSECVDGVSCTDGRCLFSQAYTEGSSWEAVQVKDRFYCGGTDVLDSVNPTDQKYAIDFMFGCQVSMTGLFITQLADGIMGMSAHPATLPKKLYDQRKIEHNLFSMCYRRELGTSKRGVTAGSMTIGGVSNSLDTSPMIYAKNLAKVGWYTVYVKNIYVRTNGGQSARSVDPNQKTIKVRIDAKAVNSGKGVIVDSGTTDTYLNQKVAKEFTRAWKQATGQTYSHSPMSLTAEQLRSLPTILIQCQAYSRDTDPSIDDYDSIPGYTGKLDPSSPKDLLIAIPATSYMDYSVITKKYMSRLYFTESAGGVLGSNTMQGHNVVFDWQNGRVGFAESTCTYDKKDVPEIAGDSQFSSDCEVADPILSKPCIETVDRRMCRNNPTSIALLGRETWTAVVESPGNKFGVSCVDAATGSGVQRNEYDAPVIRCDGEGVCEEERPCQLTCAEAQKAAFVEQLVPSLDGKETTCGSAKWSACDYSCMQTKIESAFYSDGLCHEISRQSRPCHIGACARLDPCRVPFIVHAVLGFRGGSVTKWTERSGEVLATALQNAVRRASRAQPFSVGDVNVILPLPWYHERDVFDGTELSENTDDISTGSPDGELGIKVVMEISIFNPMYDAENTTVDEYQLEDDRSEYPLSNILRNITGTLRGHKTRTTCEQEELFPLAKQALSVKDLMERDAFIVFLIGELRKAERTERFPFGPISSISYNASESSKMLSVWTIRTGIEEEINFYGPRRPITAKLLALAQSMTMVIISILFIMVFWNFILYVHDWYSSSFLRTRQPKRRDTFSSINTSAIDDMEEDFILGTGMVEITKHKPIFKLTRPTKRATRAR
jgi:hypothetical protein